VVGGGWESVGLPSPRFAVIEPDFTRVIQPNPSLPSPYSFSVLLEKIIDNPPVILVDFSKIRSNRMNIIWPFDIRVIPQQSYGK
jgi:hypothetical protein